jgi:hypothetical protein
MGCYCTRMVTTWTNEDLSFYSLTYTMAIHFHWVCSATTEHWFCNQTKHTLYVNIEEWINYKTFFTRGTYFVYVA